MNYRLGFPRRPTKPAASPRMSVGDADRAHHRFHVSYALHPVTLAPPLLTALVLPFVHPGSCSSQCMRVLRRLHLQFATDAWLIFALLALIALPFCVDVLWRLSTRHRLREAKRCMLDARRRGMLSGVVSGLAIALCGAFAVLVMVALLTLAPAPDFVGARIEVFIEMVSWWALFQCGFVASFEGAVQVAAAWSSRGNGYARRSRP